MKDYSFSDMCSDQLDYIKLYKFVRAVQDVQEFSVILTEG